MGKFIDAVAGILDRQSLFEMANLYPRSTGLPMTVFISPRGGAKHDVRVKVSTTHGNSMDIRAVVVVGVRPAPHIVRGQLSKADFAAVEEWILANEDAIVDYWNGEIDTTELSGRLRPL